MCHANQVAKQNEIDVGRYNHKIFYMLGGGFENFNYTHHIRSGFVGRSYVSVAFAKLACIDTRCTYKDSIPPFVGEEVWLERTG